LLGIFKSVTDLRVDNPPILPHFVVCRCQYCEKGIEFDSRLFEKGETRNVECPHCHLETIIFVPASISSPKPPAADAATQNPTNESLVPPKARAKSVKGTILDFTIQTNGGIISGDDGQRYLFQGAEWREAGKYPFKGMRVDFSPQADFAAAIYLIQDVPSAASGTVEKRDCNHVMAGLFGILLGAIGIHKFYMGQIQMGCIYIVAGVVTCGYGFIITAIIGLVEGIIYLTMTQSEFEKKYILNPVKSSSKNL
jgi:TM2 domain-containing membrane protein YozV